MHMSNIKPRYSQFEPNSLLDELRQRYDLPDDASCVFYRNGLNDIYKLTSERGEYYLRISQHGVHSTSEIIEEINLILCLRGSGLSVVEPINCCDGSYVWESSAPEGIRQAVLFRGIENKPAGDENARMKNLGSLIAEIHTVWDNTDITSVRPAIDKKMLVQYPTEKLTPYLRHRSDDMNCLILTAEKLWNNAETLLLKQTPHWGFCHGDIQPGNFYFNGDKPVLFDFDCMGIGYRAYDIGVLLANLTFADNYIYQKPIWHLVLEGYGAVRNLSDEEKHAIYIFAALHMIRVLAYHADCMDQMQGRTYYMTDPHLDIFFGAYRRLTTVACREADIQV